MTRHRKDDDVVHGGSIDVFADIGVQLSEEERLKIGLARLVSNIIQSRGLTQQQAADLVGVDQPKISRLVRGHVDGFTTDRLVKLLLLLGYNFEVNVRKSDPEPKGRVIFREEVAA